LNIQQQCWAITCMRDIGDSQCV